MRITLTLCFLAAGIVLVSAELWSEWGDFSPCVPLRRPRPADPNLGVKKRTRTCLENDPNRDAEKDEKEEYWVDEEDDKECDEVGLKQLEKRDCRVATEWSSFESAGECSVSCGTGEADFTRTCIQSDPRKPGAIETCQLKSVERKKRPCQKAPCPVSGGWSGWSTWSPCYSSECIFIKNTQRRGHHYRTRTCSNPYPRDGGDMCKGQFLIYGHCTEPRNCPVNGGWSRWSEYGVWNCVSGHRNRTRKCDNPPTQNGGTPCQGRYIEFFEKDKNLQLFNATCGTVPSKPGNGKSESEESEEDENEDGDENENEIGGEDDQI